MGATTLCTMAFGITTPVADVIEPFTAVICCHSVVIPSFFVIKQYYLCNNFGMAVNYHSIFITLDWDKTVPNTMIIYHHFLTLKN